MAGLYSEFFLLMASTGNDSAMPRRPKIPTKPGALPRTAGIAPRPESDRYFVRSYPGVRFQGVVCQLLGNLPASRARGLRIGMS